MWANVKMTIAPLVCLPDKDKMLVMPLSDNTNCGEVAASRRFGISAPLRFGAWANETESKCIKSTGLMSFSRCEKGWLPGRIRSLFFSVWLLLGGFQSSDLDFHSASSGSPRGSRGKGPDAPAVMTSEDEEEGDEQSHDDVVDDGDGVDGGDVDGDGDGDCDVDDSGDEDDDGDCDCDGDDSGDEDDDGDGDEGVLMMMMVVIKDSCSLQSPMVTATTEEDPGGEGSQEFIQAVEADDTFARFSLGSIRELDPPDALALRLCYCADFNADAQEARDLSIVSLRLTCESKKGDLPVREDGENDSLTAENDSVTAETQGVEDKGGATYTQVISSRYRQCEPGISANTGRQGTSSVKDSTGNTNQCSTWQVQILAYACGWDATLVLGAHRYKGFRVITLQSPEAQPANFSRGLKGGRASTAWVDPIVEKEERQQDDDSLTPGTPSLKALAAGGASADENYNGDYRMSLYWEDHRRSHRDLVPD
ncbi:hypothetical protein AK812_SmicGene16297 [Symbiodinium microadriaticum]|uniref:Uncharacterized protein n=1 Tax=Symbiodinium microadriaticum TaxID=2951 RepID=A0A1Q9E0P2_SYMMI|nr:hypothetical protein AK812_SmicGene16297 [Symbiodinium microadriaticum]